MLFGGQGYQHGVYRGNDQSVCRGRNFGDIGQKDTVRLDGLCSGPGGQHRVYQYPKSAELLFGAFGHEGGVALVGQNLLLHKVHDLYRCHGLVAAAGHSVQHGYLAAVQLQQPGHFRGRVFAGDIFIGERSSR